MPILSPPQKPPDILKFLKSPRLRVLCVSVVTKIPLRALPPPLRPPLGRADAEFL
jgi:hypothetical protein